MKLSVNHLALAHADGPISTAELDDDGACLVAWAGEAGAYRTFEFLLASLRNAHTRRAYQAAAVRFSRWCHGRGVRLQAVRAPLVAAYVDELGGSLAAPSVKLHLAALKNWFDALVRTHVLELNPAQAVRGPRYSATTGRTPVLEREDARRLLDSIDTSTVVGARDRALMTVMLFSFARVGAVVTMKVGDYRQSGRDATLNLHEKGGKFHRVPAHHQIIESLDLYLERGGLGDAASDPLWQAATGRGDALLGRAMSPRTVLLMVKRRARAIGLPDDLCSHSFRATGITLHQDAGGDLEAARQLAGHASVKTTQLYNRSGDRKRRAEVERVQL